MKSQSNTELEDAHVVHQTIQSKTDGARLLMDRHDLLYQKCRAKLQCQLQVGGLDNGKESILRSFGDNGAHVISEVDLLQHDPIDKAA
ncbi:hypothetical protein GOBAR_AA34073 [Gossypium barbadense]|uniref:Uncharacterized protein n=1 Tax=Gossypium barbadense TaxID=3634 RepID=A0A2P5W685_GOSBA|nr:hypothetical protein GOBAR_AA34073 [Gossypium barbadense]